MIIQVSKNLDADILGWIPPNEALEVTIHGVSPIELKSSQPTDDQDCRYELTIELNGSEWQCVLDTLSLQSLVAFFGQDSNYWAGKKVYLWTERNYTCGDHGDQIYSEMYIHPMHPQSE